MDRDKRWERVQKAYDVMCRAKDACTTVRALCVVDQPAPTAGVPRSPRPVLPLKGANGGGGGRRPAAGSAATSVWKPAMDDCILGGPFLVVDVRADGAQADEATGRRHDDATSSPVEYQDGVIHRCTRPPRHRSMDRSMNPRLVEAVDRFADRSTNPSADSAAPLRPATARRATHPARTAWLGRHTQATGVDWRRVDNGAMR